MNITAMLPTIIALALAVFSTVLYLTRTDTQKPMMFEQQSLPPYISLLLLYGICAVIAWVSLLLMMDDPTPAFFHFFILLGSYAVFSLSIVFAEGREEIRMLRYYGLESGLKIFLSAIAGVIGIGLMMGASFLMSLMSNVMSTAQTSFSEHAMNSLLILETSGETASSSLFQQVLFVTLNASAEELLMGVLTVFVLANTVPSYLSKNSILPYGGEERYSRSGRSSIVLIFSLIVVNLFIAFLFASLHFRAYDFNIRTYLQLTLNRLILTLLYCGWGRATPGSAWYFGLPACIVAHVGWNVLAVMFGG